MPAEDAYVEQLTKKLAAAFAEVLAPLMAQRPADGFLTVPEAAARLGIKPRKLYYMLSRGEIAYVEVGDRGRRIEARALDEYIAARRTEASDDGR